MEGNKKEFTVTIQTKELKYAVMNKTHATARSLQASGKLNYEAAAQVQVSDDGENAYELARAISDAISEVKVELSEYLEGKSSEADNLIKSQVENDAPVVLSFLLPSNFNSASAEALGSGIHGYIVGRAIYNWYRLAVPELAEACNAEAAAALVLAKSSLYKRIRPSRPTYSE